MRREGELGRFVRHRRGRRLNNRVEQEHRRITRRTRPMLDSKQLGKAHAGGVEAMAMRAKGQMLTVPASNIPAQPAFTHRAFGLAA
jgi:transposase, IS6 family